MQPTAAGWQYPPPCSSRLGIIEGGIDMPWSYRKNGSFAGKQQNQQQAVSLTHGLGRGWRAM